MKFSATNRTRPERGLPVRSGGVLGACELVGVQPALPHPGPLPLGEGETSTAMVRSEALKQCERGRGCSLSQRERARVRENGNAVRSACVRHTLHSAFRTPHFRRAFTLIELILVMALITIVVSVSLPSLKGFFRGRDLDSEARRFLSLTRYGASRAVAEGIPVELYVDTAQKLYGLRAQAGFLEQDTKRVEYKPPAEISFEVTAAPQKKASGEENFDNPDEQFLNNLEDTSDTGNPIKIIRFNSDGFIGDKSPAAVILRQRSAEASASAEGDAIAIAQSATRLTYEIRTLQQQR